MSSLEERIRKRQQTEDRDAGAKKREEVKNNVKAEAERLAMIRRLEKRGANAKPPPPPKAERKKRRPPPTDNERLTALAPPKDGETPQAYLRRLKFLIGNRKVALAHAVNDGDKNRLEDEKRILQWGVDQMYELFNQYKQFTKK